MNDKLQATRARQGRAILLVLEKRGAIVLTDDKGFQIVDLFNEPFPGEPRFCRAEFMGHVTRYGRFFEVEFAGAKLMRIDEPVIRGGVVQFWKTELRNANSIYSFRFCDESVVMDYHRKFDPDRYLAIEPPRPAPSYYEANQGNGEPDEDPHDTRHDVLSQQFDAAFAEPPKEPPTEINQLDLEALISAAGDAEAVGKAIDAQIADKTPKPHPHDTDDSEIPF